MGEASGMILHIPWMSVLLALLAQPINVYAQDQCSVLQESTATARTRSRCKPASVQADERGAKYVCFQSNLKSVQLYLTQWMEYSG